MVVIKPTRVKELLDILEKVYPVKSPDDLTVGDHLYQIRAFFDVDMMNDAERREINEFLTKKMAAA